MKICICEDIAEQSHKLRKFIEQYFELKGFVPELSEFSNAEELLVSDDAQNSEVLPKIKESVITHDEEMNLNLSVFTVPGGKTSFTIQ